jgi:hypothetical protein
MVWETSDMDKMAMPPGTGRLPAVRKNRPGHFSGGIGLICSCNPAL